MNNNINFKGYKNVIYNNMDSPMYNFRFISLELNDEGCKDLTEFKKLQSLCGNQDCGDTLHLVNSQVYNSDEFLFLNGRSMFKGSELRKLYEQYAERCIPKRRKRSLKSIYTYCQYNKKNDGKFFMHNGWRNNKSFSVCTGYFYSNV